jgi:hypothetical protein
VEARPLLGIHEAEKFFLALFRQARDERHGVVGVGARDHARELLVLDERENVSQQVGRQFLQRLGGFARGKKNIEEKPRLAGLEVLEQRRDIGGMAFADEPEDAVRRAGADHFTDSIVIQRGHDALLVRTTLLLSRCPAHLQM